MKSKSVMLIQSANWMCLKSRCNRRIRRSLPGGVPPAQRLPGAGMFPVEQKSSRYGASDQRQDADVPLGGEDSCEAAGHFYLPLGAVLKKSVTSTVKQREERTGWWEWESDEAPLMELRTVEGEGSSRWTEGGRTRPEAQISFQNKSNFFFIYFF